MSRLCPPKPQSRILIVEDENIVALHLDRGLLRLGYTVVGVVNNGLEAIQKVEEMRPDLILMDIQLKGMMDGVSAAQKIREWFNVPIIFLSAYSDENTLERAKIAEPFGYLLKPFEEAELNTMIEVVLHKHQMASLQRREFARAIKKSEESFKIFVDSVTDYAIFMVDLLGRVVSWNAGAQRILGYCEDEVIGEHISIFHPKNDIVSIKQEYQLKLAVLAGRHEEEGWHVRKDGSEFWAGTVITALRDDIGKLCGFGKVVRDLTERKKAEDELRLANESLEKRIQERTSDLREALQTRDEFLSIATHELRTPLTSLTLQLEFLSRIAFQQPKKNEVDQGSKFNKISSVHKYIKVIQSCENESKKLSTLLDELLDLTRIRIGRFELHKENMDFSSVVRDLIERKQPELTQAGVPLSVKADSPVIGHWDCIRVEQIVGNLLSNAIKYGENKPIEILVESNPKTGCVKLSVVDHGKGISSDMQQKLFNKFERAGADKCTVGLGLGLYIVKQIVKAHHGSISVASEVGKGTTFIVELPLNVSTAESLKTRRA